MGHYYRSTGEEHYRHGLLLSTFCPQRHSLYSTGLQGIQEHNASGACSEALGDPHVMLDFALFEAAGAIVSTETLDGFNLIRGPSDGRATVCDIPMCESIKLDLGLTH